MTHIKLKTLDMPSESFNQSHIRLYLLSSTSKRFVHTLDVLKTLDMKHPVFSVYYIEVDFKRDECEVIKRPLPANNIGDNDNNHNIQ